MTMDWKVGAGAGLLVAELMSRSLKGCCSVAEPMVELNVLETNQTFMEQSEELYQALMDSHWQSAEFCAGQDYLTSSLPEPLYC